MGRSRNPDRPRLRADRTGLLVQADVIHASVTADHRALAWHAYLWDPWFLIWDCSSPPRYCAADTAAATRERLAHLEMRAPGERSVTGTSNPVRTITSIAVAVSDVPG
jgi:hypothetical protein